MDLETMVFQTLKLAEHAQNEIGFGRMDQARAIMERLREMLNFGLYDAAAADAKLEATLSPPSTE